MMLKAYKYLFYWYKSKYIKKHKINFEDLNKVFGDDLNDELHEKSNDMLVFLFNTVLLAIFLLLYLNTSLYFPFFEELSTLSQKIFLLPFALVLFYIVSRYFKNKFKKNKEEINKMNFNDFTKKYKLKMFILVWCIPLSSLFFVIFITILIDKFFR